MVVQRVQTLLDAIERNVVDVGARACRVVTDVDVEVEVPRLSHVVGHADVRPRTVERRRGGEGRVDVADERRLAVDADRDARRLLDRGFSTEA